MTSERMQRRIDRLLDDAEEAADQHDWDRVLECVRGVLAVDPENQDAVSLRTMAEAAADEPPVVSDESSGTQRPTASEAGRPRRGTC